MLKEHTAITGPDNRGLRYGDGLFETIKYKQNKFILIDEHLSRLWKGIQLMEFKPSKFFTPDQLQDETIRLLKRNKLENARIRITLIRGNGGLYDTGDHSPHYIIQAWPLIEKKEVLNSNGLQLCIYHDAKKNIDKFSNLKHNNYLPYFMGALFAKKQSCNDAIILNSTGGICDTTIANIFIIKNGFLRTPSLKEGCVAGIMRKHIIHQLSLLQYQVSETAITQENLLEADEIFLTNSIYNMHWVAGIGDKKYSNTKIKEIYMALCKTNEEIFC